LPNFGWINDSAGDPSILTPNHQHRINKWIKDSNIKVNQYTNPNTEPSPQGEPTMQVGTSSQLQPQSYASMPNFFYDPNYYSTFELFMVPPNTNSMQDYFGYITNSLYHLLLNQYNEM
jgi:hypothetical protein